MGSWPRPEAAVAVAEHPCFDEAAHSRYARLHLAVAPRCNIRCAYCDRRLGDCVHGNRPGMARRVLRPREVPELVRATLRSEPRLRVIGVAGPGEPLANPETFEALALAGRTWAEEASAPPVFCLSTNGLLLAEAVPRLVEHGVSTVTVTMSAVTPRLVELIYVRLPEPPEVASSGAGQGAPAVHWFTGRQLAGIRRAAEAGLAVKVNTVLIPGVNLAAGPDAPGERTEADRQSDFFEEVRQVAEAAAEAGACIQNIVPLIPLGAFAGLRPPACEELRRAREEAGLFVPQFRLCRQCRADAAGVPAEEPFPETTGLTIG